MRAGIAFRIAFHLVTRPRLENRWRTAAILVSCVAAMLLTLLAASIYVLLEREQARVDARTPMLAAPNEPAGLKLLTSDDTWREKQIQVHWIEPVDGVEAVLPPGLSRMLEPGEAAVSPRLDQLARTHAELAARYPRRIVIGSEGLRSPDELMAYYRPAEGRTLGDSPFVMRIAAFGDGPPERRGPSLGTEDPPNGKPIFLLLAAFVVLPALVLAGCGLAALSDVRQHRFQVLQWLGAPPSMLAAIALFEVLLLAAPCAALTSFGWYWLTSRLESIPLLDRAVVRGDLQPPLWLCLSAAAAVALAAACLAAATAALNYLGRSPGTRPGFRRAALSPLRLALLFTPWLSFAVAEFLRLDRKTKATMVGLALLAPAAVVGAPSAVRVAGRLFSPAKSVVLFLTGRRMAWDPFGAGRPFLALTALAALLIGAVAYDRIVDWEARDLGTTGSVQKKSGSSVVAVLLGWSDPRPGDIERLQAALGPETVVLGLSRSRDGALTLYGSCPRLAAVFESLSCDPAEPYVLPPAAGTLLPEFVQPIRQSFGSVQPQRTLPELSGDTPEVVDRALVLSAEPQEELEQRTSIAAMTHLPAPNFQRAAGPPVPNALVFWLRTTTAVGASALVLATALLALNGIIEWRRVVRPLLTMGMRREQVNRLQTTQFAVPFAVHAGFGWTVGTLGSWAAVRVMDTPMPWTAIALIAVTFAAVGLVGSVLAYGFAPALQLRDTRD